MTSPEPRFVRVSRRAFLARSAAVGGLLAVPTLACAKSDADVFASASSTTSPVPATAAPTSTTTTNPPRTSSTTSSTTSSSTTSTTSAPASGASFPSGAELVVNFTFAASGGRVNNPFIAVWVEDPDGNLVDTISLWFERGKGVRWLPDLRRWYSASDGGDDTTMSGATRVAGSYTVTWDGTDLDGKPVPAGDYVLHIEAAREHGPYELVTGDLAIGDEPFQITLNPSGELTAASAELRV